MQLQLLTAGHDSDHVPRSTSQIYCPVTHHHIHFLADVPDRRAGGPKGIPARLSTTTDWGPPVQNACVKSAIAKAYVSWVHGGQPPRMKQSSMTLAVQSLKTSQD